jgi:hypothetical protein
MSSRNCHDNLQCLELQHINVHSINPRMAGIACLRYTSIVRLPTVSNPVSAGMPSLIEMDICV